MKIALSVLILGVMSSNVLAETSIPDWFLEDLEKHVGTWVADNGAYQSYDEPQSGYGMQWQWGIGKTSITGRLYGIVNGKNTGDFWHFRQYWDNQKQTAVLVQYGSSGVIGTGEFVVLDGGEMQVIQEFSVPTGRTWRTKHLSTNDGKIQHTTSYDLGQDGNWIKRRSYIWLKEDASE